MVGFQPAKARNWRAKVLKKLSDFSADGMGMAAHDAMVGKEYPRTWRNAKG